MRNTRLHRASENGNLQEVVRLLSGDGIDANPNVPNGNKRTPLHSAMFCQKPAREVLDLVKALLDAKQADPERMTAPDRMGYTPLHLV